MQELMPIRGSICFSRDWFSEAVLSDKSILGIGSIEANAAFYDLKTCQSSVCLCFVVRFDVGSGARECCLEWAFGRTCQCWLMRCRVAVFE